MKKRVAGMIIEELPDGTRRTTHPSGLEILLSKEEKYEEDLRLKLIFKTRKSLIDKPNCNFDCPKGNEFHCCNAKKCRNNLGHFRYGELELFSEKEQKDIFASWDAEVGFYRKNKGCILSRNLISYTCLEHNCHEK